MEMDPKVVAAIIAGLFSTIVLAINIAHLVKVRKSEAKNKACEMFLDLSKGNIIKNETNTKTLDFVETIMLQSLFESQANGGLLRQFLKFDDPQWAKETYFRYRELFVKVQWEQEPEKITFKECGKLKWASTLLFILIALVLFGGFAIFLGTEFNTTSINNSYSFFAGLFKFLFTSLGILFLALCFPILDRLLDCLVISESTLQRAFKLSSNTENKISIQNAEKTNMSFYVKARQILRISYESLKG